MTYFFIVMIYFRELETVIASHHKRNINDDKIDVF
jgi:hypothetical protein